MNIEIEQLLRLMKFYAENEGEYDEPLTEEEEALLEELSSYVTQVETSEETEYKWVYYTTIYKVVLDSQVIYVDVTASRSNSGYWSDSERGETTSQRVWPKEIKKIIYTTQKPEGE